mmetsp:Transcript_41952/g.90075  ORF Transcript_41952/g.90075 Transcript_41952/m.90075 type:complete len:487 (-) Transcript_41952:262-1722(-)
MFEAAGLIARSASTGSSSSSKSSSSSNKNNSNSMKSKRSKNRASSNTSSGVEAGAGVLSRKAKLVQLLLSPAVQSKPALELAEEPAKLSEAQVTAVFTKYVPKVKEFFFRGKPGQPSLKFLVSAYRSGLQAFRGTELEKHLIWCIRFVVHQGHNRRPDVGRHLIEVAEAFTECQAVQARAIEKAALAMLGVAPDFREALVKLVGDYKGIALKMLAYERVALGLARDFDAVPTHYENRLTADLGPFIGANPEDIRRSLLDGHAASRFPVMVEPEAAEVAARCRELFDLDAVLQVFVGEVNSFSEKSDQASLASLFVRWLSTGEGVADERKHVLLDEDTLSRPDIDSNVALAVFEKIFLGAVDIAEDRQIRGIPVRKIFAESSLEVECEASFEADGDQSTGGSDFGTATSGLSSPGFFSAPSESGSEHTRQPPRSRSQSADGRQEIVFFDSSQAPGPRPSSPPTDSTEASAPTAVGEKRRKTDLSQAA